MSAMSNAIGEVGASSYVNAPSTVYQDQVITWKPCSPSGPERFQCGSIKVPLDWTGVNTDTLTIPLARWAADPSYPDAKSIFVNNGGPGSSPIEWLMSGIDLKAPSKADFDAWLPSCNFIAFDPRGVGVTVPYRCPDIYEHEDLDMTIAEYLQYTEQGARCARADVREQGELMGTAFVARDINAIAEALGEDGLIRFYGLSYGTVLGATLAAMFPDKIERMVLDGNVNPTEFYHGTYEESASGFDPAVKYFFSQCHEEREEACPFAETGNSMEELKTNFNNILSTQVPGSRSYRDFVVTFEDTLSHPRKWYDYVTGLLETYKDLQSVESLDKRDSQPSPETNEAAGSDWKDTAIVAINCGDWDDIPLTLSNWQELLARYENVSEIGGRWAMQITLGCSAWQLNSREKYHGTWTGIKTKHPVLFVNGLYDTRTPIESAINASAGFIDSEVLIHDGPGHCSDASSSLCTVLKVADYFVTGKMPDVSKPCKSDDPPFAASKARQGSQEPSAKLKARGSDNMAFSKYPEVLQRLSRENDHLYQTPYDYAQKGSCAPVPDETGPYIPVEDPPVAQPEPGNEHYDGDEESDGKSVVTGTQPPWAAVQAEINSFHEMCSKVKDGSWVLRLLCNTMR